MNFDPNAAAQPGSGIFGLPESPDAKVLVLPVPFDATTSYAKGAADGPDAIVEASKQVDLFDLETGKPYEAGIALLEQDGKVVRQLRKWNREASKLAQPIIDAGGQATTPRLAKALSQVNRICEQVNGTVAMYAAAAIKAKKIVATLGGDHATPFGAIQAHAEAYPDLGVLHFDAHADLRVAYEGFTWSHASIMFNVAHLLPVQKLVQVGVRDFCEEELELIKASRGRIVTHFDAHLAAARQKGISFQQLCQFVVRDLPKNVYVSFDIDGLDPSLCPNTGTPVPGGLSFNEANAILRELVVSGRRIVGFDLNEVSPGKDGSEWDANVGARMLYKLIGWTLKSQEKKARR
ncbi:MAG TPA: agmatinase family protein [Myxococcales bacterium]|jgi:agmatinase